MNDKVRDSVHGGIRAYRKAFPFFMGLVPGAGEEIRLWMCASELHESVFKN